MFALRIHAVEDEHPLPETAAAVTAPPGNRILSERRGVIHLFRSDSLFRTNTSVGAAPAPPPKSATLFVIAVPSYLSPDGFLRFCNSHVYQLSHVLFLRNDGVQDRYSVLISFINTATADSFYCNLNGKWFSTSENEACHLLFAHSVEYTELSEIAGTPPDGFTELPTCPVCLERLDHEASGILNTFCDHSFHCSCTSKWTYLSCQVCWYCEQQDEKPTCSVCETSENLWACMICGFVGCGRYKEGHAIRHWKEKVHCFSLDLDAQQVWDYVGDSYVHRLNQSKSDGKHEKKNSYCASIEDDYDTWECSGGDTGISHALFQSKVEAIADEYNRLLATQLETQRQYYECLLEEARQKAQASIPEAVEKVVASRMKEMQHLLDTCAEEKMAVAAINEELINNQDMLRRKAKEIEEREADALRMSDDKIRDLQEQIRDLTVYIEAQKTVDRMNDSDRIRDGHVVLPAPPKSDPSPANSRRKPKLSRKKR